MGTTDVFLLVIIISVLVVGFFWGAARSLMLLAAWLFAFLAGAYLQLEVGSYLAGQWTSYLSSFSVMAAFGLVYMGLLLSAPILIAIFTRGNQRVSRSQVLDDVVGAVFAVFVAVLGIAGVMIVLATFYGTGQEVVDPTGGPEWTAALYQNLIDSNIGAGISEQLIPLIGVVLGPILPANVRDVFG